MASIPHSKFLILNSLLLVLMTAAAGCGRKGPPLPPLVRVPVAPGDLTATRRGQNVELKFVVPQGGVDPTAFEHLDFESFRVHLDFESFRVQPMDGPDVTANTELAVKFCLDHPRWQLSLQTHKHLGIP